MSLTLAVVVGNYITRVWSVWSGAQLLRAAVLILFVAYQHNSQFSVFWALVWLYLLGPSVQWNHVTSPGQSVVSGRDMGQFWAICQWKVPQSIRSSTVTITGNVPWDWNSDSPHETWDGQVRWVKMNFCSILPLRFGGCSSPQHNLVYPDWCRQPNWNPVFFLFEPEHCQLPLMAAVSFQWSTTGYHMLYKVLDIFPILQVEINFLILHEKTEPQQVAATWMRWYKPISC